MPIKVFSTFYVLTVVLAALYPACIPASAASVKDDASADQGLDWGQPPFCSRPYSLGHWELDNYPVLGLKWLQLSTASKERVALAQDSGIAKVPTEAEAAVPAVHPVLMVKPHEPLDGKALNPSVFKKLNGLLRMREPYKAWDDSYEMAEADAADQFCVQVKGMTKIDIEKLAGPPSFKREDIPSLLADKYGKENWLYVFGVTPELVTLYFENGVCTETFSETYDKNEWYCRWRKYEFEKFVVGKSVAEILAEEGPPPLALSHAATC